jgi:methionine synthase I (cobalamin-dependent)
MDFVGEVRARVICGDGAIGTLLLGAGVPLERCFEELCVSEPGRIRAIHEDYIAAGAGVIKTNTFGANAVRLGRFGLGKSVAEINRAAVEVARTAARGRDVFIAGSVGPLDITADDADERGIDRKECFGEQIAALLEAGADLIVFETFTDFAEMELARLAKNEAGHAPEICSFACRPDGRLRCGTMLNDAFARLQNAGARVFGVNCMNDPREMVELLQQLSAGYLLAVYPTAGQPQPDRDGGVYGVTPEMFADAACAFVGKGARLLGGCCGTTSAHVTALAKAIRDLPPG